MIFEQILAEGSDTFLDVYLNNVKMIFLEDPDIQQKFFQNIIESVSLPENHKIVETHGDMILKVENGL